MKIIRYILIIIFILFLYTANIYASINLTVSPIKYEIVTNTGEIITKSAILFNNSSGSYTITTGKSDFESRDNSGNPYFIRKNDLSFSGQSLSNWININTSDFVIGPGEKKEITFSITIPNDATPGGYYSAVFFKNKNSQTNSGAIININVDYGILLLVKVEGKIYTKGNTKETLIKNNSSFGWGGGKSKYKIDDCKIDLTNSQFDGKCIDNFFGNSDFKKDIDKLKLDEESKIKIDDFKISFDTLFENQGNIHLKPIGKIELTDESGKILKGIGKKITKNDAGATIGYEIVDYIPINDNGGNVLPQTNRNLQSEWKGFPYKSYNSNGDIIVNYWTPEEYYTKKNVKERGFLYPWERINERLNHEKITAKISLSYIDNEGKIVEFNSAQDFYIDYKDQYIGLNPYVLTLIGIFLFLGYILRKKIYLIFIRKKNNICINDKCREIIKKDITICPYCKVNQNNKKRK